MKSTTFLVEIGDQRLGSSESLTPHEGPWTNGGLENFETICRRLPVLVFRFFSKRVVPDSRSPAARIR